MISRHKDIVIEITVEDGMEGVRTLRITHWNGVCLICPWTRYREECRREQFQRDGVYMLVSQSAGKQAVYIGELSELQNHRNETRWEQVIVFSTESKKNPLNLTMSKYIALYLSHMMAEKHGHNVVSTRELEPPLISDGDRITCEHYLDAINAFWRHIGIYTYKENLASEETIPVTVEVDDSTETSGEAEPSLPPSKFRYRISAESTKDVDSSIVYSIQLPDLKGKAEGYAVKNPGKPDTPWFVVNKGSYARKDVANAVLDHPSYKYSSKKRKELLREGTLEVLAEVENCLVFTKDYRFSSPSMAAQVIRGNTANGYKEWKDNKQRTLGDNLGRKPKTNR